MIETTLWISFQKKYKVGYFFFRPLGKRLEAVKYIQKITEGLNGYKVIKKMWERNEYMTCTNTFTCN